jgi:hypothetical protein
VSQELLFETSRFNLSDVKPHFINPICFGEDLARWLAARLRERGMSATEPDQEDWGWYFDVEHAGVAYFIAIGGNASEEHAVANHGEWRVSIDRHRSMMDKLRGRGQIERVDPVVSAVYSVLAGEGDFDALRFEEP